MDAISTERASKRKANGWRKNLLEHLAVPLRRPNKALNCWRHIDLVGRQLWRRIVPRAPLYTVEPLQGPEQAGERKRERETPFGCAAEREWIKRTRSCRRHERQVAFRYSMIRLHRPEETQGGHCYIAVQPQSQWLLGTEQSRQ